MELKGFRIGVEHLAEPYRSLVAKLLDSMLREWGENLVSLVVFGSVARGDARRDSDIDLLIVCRELPRSRLARQVMFEKVEEMISSDVEDLWRRGYLVDFSPILLTVEEARKHRPIYLDMVQDAVIVFDRGSFMERVLSKLAKKLEELGAERVWIGKKWY